MAFDVVPARAGVDLARFLISRSSARGPRASGGGPFANGRVQQMIVWSPRERGWTDFERTYSYSGNVVPARAGVDHVQAHLTRARICGPRASGGGPAAYPTTPTIPAWSPRERGWTQRADLLGAVAKVVPARAGVDPWVVCVGRRRISGPRASGGGPGSAGTPAYESLWSPRERGWTRFRSYLSRLDRVVPARAGVDPHHGAAPDHRGSGPRASGGGPSSCGMDDRSTVWSPRERGWT